MKRPIDPEDLNRRYRPSKHLTAGELRAAGVRDIPEAVPDSSWLPLSSRGREEGGLRFWCFVRPYEFRA